MTLILSKIGVQRLTPLSRSTITRLLCVQIIVVTCPISFLFFNWSDIPAITADYRLTVEVKNIKEAAVITKLTSSPLEGKPVEENLY